MTTTTKKPLIALIAGEHSGDLLGANLMQALKRQHAGDVEFIGVGGPLMIAEGLTSLVPMDDLAVMGLAEVLKHLPKLLAHRRYILRELQAAKPDVFIGIDAPDFNLPIAKRLKAGGMPTMHYVSPSVWAWRQGRIKGIKASVDHVLCLLPFEKQFYDEHDLPATFVGHPLADEIPEQWSIADARAALALDPNTSYIGLLPGSRGGEIERLAPVYLATAQRLWQANPARHFLVPMISDARREQFLQLQRQLAPELPCTVIMNNSRTAIAAADAVLLTSGTVTLETLLIKRPMVVAYKFNWLSHKLMLWLFKAPFFSLPNLLAGWRVVPELVQDEVTATRLAAELEQQLTSPNDSMLTEFLAIHRELKRDAGELAATAVQQLMKDSGTKSE